MTATTDTPTFTDQTWAKLGNRGLCRETGRDLGWMRQHDLAVEAHAATRDFCRLTFDHWRTLVSAICSGLPVEMVVETRRADQWSGRTTVETTRAMFLVEQQLWLSTGYGTSVRRWGFGTTYSLTQLVSVEAPEAEYGFTTYTEEG